MADKKNARQRAIIKKRIFLSCCSLVVIAAIVIISFTINLIVKSTKDSGKNESDLNLSSDTSSKEPEIPYVKSSATVINTGDILIHSTVLDGAYNKASNDYDFGSIFPNVSPYFKNANLAVANLEVTFGGAESGAFSGYPAFNTPDILADVIKDCGISMLLTANNHCYDTGFFGLKRTVQVLKEKNIGFIGTKQNLDDPSYVVKDVNGVKIGMTVYTYENKNDIAGRKSINGNIISAEANNYLNSFSYQNLEAFYTEAEQTITAMKAEGADCVVFYMHWGEEYQLSANTWQKTIAQRLCNLGVDVIVGGHPHVIQPVELLHSENSQSTTVCLYSMGNGVSNQRQEIMNPECTTGHTEDGVLFSYTFDKYSDGTVKLSKVDLIPTWVNKYSGGSGYLYQIIPLENANDGSEKYGLSGAAATKSAASYERTKALVGEGLTQCQIALGSEIRFKQ